MLVQPSYISGSSRPVRESLHNSVGWDHELDFVQQVSIGDHLTLLSKCFIIGRFPAEGEGGISEVGWCLVLTRWWSVKRNAILHGDGFLDVPLDVALSDSLAVDEQVIVVADDDLPGIIVEGFSAGVTLPFSPDGCGDAGNKLLIDEVSTPDFTQRLGMVTSPLDDFFALEQRRHGGIGVNGMLRFRAGEEEGRSCWR